MEYSGSEMDPSGIPITITEDMNLTQLGSNETVVAPRYTGWQAVMIGLVCSIVIFLSIGGNLLVCISVFSERSLRKTTNFFYVSLAIADMLVAILVMTFAVANDIMGYWIFDNMFCSIWISFDIMSSTSSILNLCTISMDRYIHIKFPFRYEACMTNKLALGIIAGVWVCSALISFLPIHLGWHSFSHDYTVPRLQPNGVFQCYLELNPSYAVISSCVSFYVPCAMMIGIYWRMYKYAQKHVKNIKRTCGPESGERVRDQKAAITLGVIMGTFLFCWFPFFTMNIIASACGDCVSGELFSGLTWLGYINSCLNPIIYSIFNTEFRRAFYKILCMKMPCCNDDKSLSFKLTRTHSTSQSYRSQAEVALNGSSNANVRKPLNHDLP
jgi:dopamine D1-like receptor